MAEATYPYVAVGLSCKYNVNDHTGVLTTGYT